MYNVSGYVYHKMLQEPPFPESDKPETLSGVFALPQNDTIPTLSVSKISGVGG